MDLSDQFEACLLCDSRQLSPLQGYEKNYLIKCNACGFVFCKRKPSIPELEAHYNLYPRANSISPITVKRYDELLDKFEKYRVHNNLIDVGCGDGFFLERAKIRGWNVYGTEFTDGAIAICERKGIQMTKSPIDARHYPEGIFDVVTSFEVIEHINNPRRELRSFYTMLRKGGIVYVTTPNFNSISRNIKGSDWNIIEYPEHLSYYTKKTLHKVFRDENFTMLNVVTTGISINRIKGNSAIPSPSDVAHNVDEDLREKTEQRVLFRILKMLINSLLNFTGKGDAIKAFFQKR